MRRISPAWVLPIVFLLIGETVQAEESCIPTKGDYLGPFYISGTAETENLNRQGRPGTPLVVVGRILSAASDRRALAEAKVEVWQTDGAGNYYPQGAGDAADYTQDELDLRGVVRTDSDGRYQFATVVPGNYFPRPRHFHYRISAVDHKPLVTQLYITGDGFVSQPGDKCRHAPLEKNAQGLRYEAPDIYLQLVD
jgi:protocatechuate 3,4-dioxygenase beta subunit